MRIKQIIIVLLQCLKLLIFFLLLLTTELLRFFEDHILVLISLCLNLGLLGGQCSFELLYLSLVVIYLSFLKDLPRLKQVLIILMQSYGGFKFLIILFDKFQELVLDSSFLLRSKWRGNDSFEADRLTKEILFLDVRLLKNTNVRELLQFFDFLLCSEIQFT